MSKDQLSCCQNHALRGLCETLIGRPLDHAEGFEVNPHGVSGVGQAAMRECVGSQQVSEFVMHGRLGNRQNRQ